jgi:hypothetical protein
MSDEDEIKKRKEGNLLWACFLNWSFTLEQIENRKDALEARDYLPTSTKQL